MGNIFSIWKKCLVSVRFLSCEGNAGYTYPLLVSGWRGFARRRLLESIAESEKYPEEITTMHSLHRKNQQQREEG